MLAQQKEAIISLFQGALAHLGVPDTPVTLERPKCSEHGDIACNIAMQLARVLKQKPRDIAEKIVAFIKNEDKNGELISSVEIAGPGFINIRVANTALQDIVRQVLTNKDQYGCVDTHKNESVLLEFVSANPTGPLHLGHARQGALGDVLANIFSTQGWRVTREFYYNDAGVQIGNLALSVQLRAKELLGETIELPENAYHGEYIISIAKDFLAKENITHSRRCRY